MNYRAKVYKPGPVSGRLEGWKAGRLGVWEVGRMGAWETGY